MRDGASSGACLRLCSPVHGIDGRHVVFYDRTLLGDDLGGKDLGTW
jgi:hypothetical protein